MGSKYGFNINYLKIPSDLPFFDYGKTILELQLT